MKRQEASPITLLESQVPLDTSRVVHFLGESFSRDDYKQACKNLDNFFSILRTWRDKEESGEEA